MRHIYRPLVLVTLALLVSAPSRASVVLDFEGLSDGQDILDFYDGGGGTDFNIVFDADAQASIDFDAGGTGNFGNEPSPNTIAVLSDVRGPLDTLIMNAMDGFGGFLAFSYASLEPFEVIVYSGFDATGSILGSILLPSTGFFLPQGGGGCDIPGDPNGQFNCWGTAQIDFADTAHSVRYIGRSNGTGLDDIELGSIPDDPSVPEPGLVSLLGVGLAFIAARRRSRGIASGR